jgi:superfamily II DNA/RNA helicase
VRGRRLAALRAAELRVLVATNVAARGIDVAGLEAVVNYELPRSTADYTHRVGRTGRAGEAGVAVSFVTSTGPGNAAHFDLIERRHGGMRVPREVVPAPGPATACVPEAATACVPRLQPHACACTCACTCHVHVHVHVHVSR